MIDRSRRYLYYIVVEVEQRGMPLEIALLPMVESAFNPMALSASRASGIWQFMPSTGKHYGLKQNFWFDSRRDVVAATDGALNYLQKLHGDFDDWQLALAAYNWGEGNVARGDREEPEGGPADRLCEPHDARRDAQLPAQAAGGEEHRPRPGEVRPRARRHPGRARISRWSGRPARSTSRRAAELAEMPVDEFQYLNPHHNRPVIAGADEYTILLPIDKAELFAAKLELTDQPLVSWQAYRLRTGETLPQVAAKFGMSVETLRAVNGIGAKSKVPAGHTLLVPSQGPAEDAAETLTQAVFTTVPQGRTFYYRVKRGDTLRGDRRPLRGDRAGPAAVEQPRAERGVTAGQPLRITSDLAPNAGQGQARGREEGRADAGETAAAKRRRRPRRRREGRADAARRPRRAARDGKVAAAKPRRRPADPRRPRRP